jgi:hypothetical protein
MPDFQTQASRLSKRVAELEAELGAACGDYVELVTEIAPFLTRFRSEVMRYHNALALAQRELADVRVYLGDAHSLSRGQPESPLDELLKREEPTVQEQYDRVWGNGSQNASQTTGPQGRAPASPEVKQLFAKAVARLHPDFAQSEEERKRNLSLFNRVGTAYLNRDQRTLQSVVDSLTTKTNLPAVADYDVIRKLEDRIYQLETVSQNISGQYYDYRYGDVARIRVYALQAEEEGRDLLADLSENLQRTLRNTLEELKKLKRDLEQK